jgi:ketosteroid isomerase-like protein
MRQPFRACSLLPAVGLLMIASQLSAAPANETFKKMIDSYWAAWGSMDFARISPMYAQDADAIFFDVAPMKYAGFGEYKAGASKLFATAESAKFTANGDVTGEQRGNFAWTSETFTGVINQKGGSVMKFDGRHTAIWEKRGGKWIIVHEHVSEPLPE